MSELYPESSQIPAMLIWKVPEGKKQELYDAYTNGQYFAELKIDGCFYEYEKTQNHAYLFSRSVSKITGELSEKSANVPHIMEALSCLPSDTIIIGEIYYPGKTSKDVTTVMGCLAEEAIKRQQDNPIHYYLHDIIRFDGIDLMKCGAEERYDILAGVWAYYNLGQYDFLQLAEKITENISETLSKILQSGGEGIVLKQKNAPYIGGKRPAHLTIKVKQSDSIDLVCCGLCDATKEYTGKELDSWPYWEYTDSMNNTYMSNTGKPCNEAIPITKYYFYGQKTAIEIGAYDDNGNMVKLGTVSSGLTDEDKEQMTEHPEEYIGKVVSLDCMSINKVDHTLRHPIIKCFRDDKNAKDCIISEVFK